MKFSRSILLIGLLACIKASPIISLNPRGELLVHYRGVKNSEPALLEKYNLGPKDFILPS
jgi:hypothetical protein